MPRVATKKTRVLAEAQRDGELNAQRKHDKRVFKNWGLWFREQAEKLIDNIDTLEMLAVLALTFLLHEMISGAADLLAQVGRWTKAPKGLQDILKAVAATGTLVGFGVPMLLPAGVAMAEDQKIDIYVWLISFVLAFIIMRHGSEIIESMGGLKEMIGSFFAMGGG